MDPLQTIAAGTIANDGTGDSLRVAAQKANANFEIIALNDTEGTSTLTGTKVWDGSLTEDVEFNDIATMTLDATNLNLSAVASVSVSSTGAGASQGQVEIRADQQLTVLTPAVVAQTAAVGQVLRLTDAVNGVVEFANYPGGIITGTATLVSGAATVNNTNVTATSRIFLTHQSASGAHGYLHVVSRVAGVSFTVNSSNGSDLNTFAWMIVQP
jgi:hypothetical protein